MAIYGGSYGGYATLAGLTYTPDLYACAVDYVGVSNLFTFMKTVPPYWEPYKKMMYEMVGDPKADSLMMREASPVFHVDRIKCPLFIAQGANDPRVNKDESDQMVEALERRGINVQYMVKDNEGHGFHNEENRFDFYGAMEEFLDQHIGAGSRKTEGCSRHVSRIHFTNTKARRKVGLRGSNRNREWTGMRSICPEVHRWTELLGASVGHLKIILRAARGSLAPILRCRKPHVAPAMLGFCACLVAKPSSLATKNNFEMPSSAPLPTLNFLNSQHLRPFVQDHPSPPHHVPSSHAHGVPPREHPAPERRPRTDSSIA